MLTSTLRLLTAALTLMSAATVTELPRKADDLRPRATHRPAHELTDVCRVEPVVSPPAPIATSGPTTSTAPADSPAATSASSCTDVPRARSEASQ